MTVARIDPKWFQFHKRILRWQNKHRSDQNTRLDQVRERSISTLQKRYGFDREKAIAELDRIYSKAQLW
jgi:hypothetical protein